MNIHPTCLKLLALTSLALAIGPTDAETLHVTFEPRRIYQLSSKYVSMNSKYTGEASILAIIMMIFGVAIMLMNQLSLTSRKNYTTVTGKSGQISKINLGKAGKYVIALVLVILTFFTIKAQIGLISAGTDTTWAIIRAVIAVLLIILAIDLVIEGIKTLKKQAQAKAAN